MRSERKTGSSWKIRCHLTHCDLGNQSYLVNLKDALQQTDNSNCGIYALIKLHNWMSQFVQPSLPTRQLSSKTVSFARDHIALDLATQKLDSFANWAQRELRTPLPKHKSIPNLLALGVLGH
jgi:hypothetical protein